MTGGDGAKAMLSATANREIHKASPRCEPRRRELAFFIPDFGRPRNEREACEQSRRVPFPEKRHEQSNETANTQPGEPVARFRVNGFLARDIHFSTD